MGVRINKLLIYNLLREIFNSVYYMIKMDVG